MRKYFFLVFLILSFSGCTTVKLAQGPAIDSLPIFSNAPNVGVAKTLDQREKSYIGTIGASPIHIKEGLPEATSNYLTYNVNTLYKLNVVQIPETPDSEKITEIAKKYAVTRVIVPKIKAVRMFSLDAILQPVEVNVDMLVDVYDISGKEVFHETVTGQYEKRIGLSVGNKSIASLVEMAIREAVSNLVKNENFESVVKTAL
jgi:hypothetical protein